MSIQFGKLIYCIFSIGSGEGWGTSNNVEVLNIGAKVHVHTIKAETKYGGDTGKVALEGPNAGFDIGIRSNVENSVISAMAELNAAKAEVILGPAYACGNLNTNTGLKAESQGFQANYLGFGLTLGVSGRWTFDTPFGSVGASTANVLVHKTNRLIEENKN